MKILMVAANYPPVACGMADYTYKLCQALYYLTEFKPVVLTSTTGGKNTQTQSDNDKITVTRLLEKWNWYERFKFTRYLRQEAPRLVHIQYHDHDFPDTTLVTSMPKLIKKYDKSVAVVLSLANFDLEDSAVVQMIGNCDIITVTTDEDRERLLKFDRTLQPIVKLVYDGPNITLNDALTPDIREIRKRLDVAIDQRLLVFFGFPSPAKGIEEIFRALRLLCDRGCPCKLLMLGGRAHDGRTDDHYLQGLDRLQAELKLKQNITWSGYVSSNDVTMALRAADIAIMPFKDGVSGKRSSFWSVLDHGVPVVTTKGKYIPTGLEHKLNVILVEKADPDLLADAVELLWGSSATCSEIGRLGQELVREHYSWAHLCKKIFTIYNQALENK